MLLCGGIEDWGFILPFTAATGLIVDKSLPRSEAQRFLARSPGFAGAQLRQMFYTRKGRIYVAYLGDGVYGNTERNVVRAI